MRPVEGYEDADKHRHTAIFYADGKIETKQLCLCVEEMGPKGYLHTDASLLFQELLTDTLHSLNCSAGLC